MVKIGPSQLGVPGDVSLTDAPPPGKGKKPDPSRDAIGHEFAGEAGISESIGGPRPSPGQPARVTMRPRPVPRAPKPSVPAGPPARPPPPPPLPPDPTIAGSKYFAPSPAKSAAPRQLANTHRERDSDSDAIDSTLDEDLDAITRRRERERASHGPAPAPDVPQSGGVATRKDLDAEARPRELDDGDPDFARRRRGGHSP